MRYECFEKVQEKQQRSHQSKYQDNMDPRSGHPDWAYCPATLSVDGFKSALTAGLDNQYDGLDPNDAWYLRACVLIFRWGEDSQSLYRAVRLEETFRSLFHYDVIQVTLPSSGSTVYSMSEVIRNTQTNYRLGEDDLIIFCYIGGSAHYGHGNSMEVFLEPSWGPSIRAHSHVLPGAINFTRVQRECINQIRGDVLMLMDCPLASSLEPWYGKEIIAASRSENDPSFSHRLNEQLRRAATDRHVLTSQQLYARLVTATITNSPNGGELGSIPIHMQSHGQRRKSIFLAPPAMAAIPVPSNWRGARLGPAAYQQVVVILTVRLRDTDRGVVDLLRSWLGRSLFDGEGRVELHQSYYCGSEVVVFKVTLDVWCSLRGYPAISFVAFEQRFRPAFNGRSSDPSGNSGLAEAPTFQPPGLALRPHRPTSER